MPLLISLDLMAGQPNHQNSLFINRKLLLLVLLCGTVLMLLWFASRIQAPLNLFNGDKRQIDTTAQSRNREFAHAAAVETETEVLFYQGNYGYNTSRIPALVHHKDIFFAFCEGRKDSFYDIGEMDIILRRGVRRDWKVTWGPVQVVARRAGYRMMNPVPIVDTTIDMILLVFNTYQSERSHWDAIASDKYETNLFVIKSLDLGETWTPPQDITEEIVGRIKPTPTVYGPGPGHGIQTTTGRLIVPGKVFFKLYEPGQKEFHNGTISQANVIYSDDHGRTWRPGGRIPYGEDPATGNGIFSGESMVVEFNSKHLCLNARTLHPDQPRLQAFSYDEGISFSTGQLAWTLIEPGYYPEDNLTKQEEEDEEPKIPGGPFLLEDNYTRPSYAPGCQASMLGFPAPHLFPSRTWVLFSNPANPTFRRKMAIRISKNGCRTWSKPWIIHANASAYSDLAYFETWDSNAKAHSLNFGILFEAGIEHSYESIQFKMFSLEQVLQRIGLATSHPDK